MNLSMYCKTLISIMTVTCLNTFAQTKPIKLGVTIDFLDTAFYLKKGEYVTPQEIRERMRLLAQAGVSKFYFRACPGVAYYPSKVLKMFAGDGRKKEWDDKLIKSITKNDILKEYSKACKEFGIKLYYWEPIFDNEISPVNYPAQSAKAKEFGEYPLADEYFQKNKHLLMKYRYADSLESKAALKTAITKIKLFSDISAKPRLTRQDIKLYVGNQNNYPALKPYTKDFTFSVDKENGKYVVTLDKLDIENKIIKITQNHKDKNYTVVFDTRKPGWCQLYGSKEKIDSTIISGETTYGIDKQPCSLSKGTGTRRTAWDYNGRSLIIYMGKFDKYAGGMSCYAIRAARDRRLAIAKEILTNYPDIAGIAYSMRSHSKTYGSILDFGFNDIIVKEYQKRYGINILKQNFDRQKFLKVRGDFFSEFIGEVGKLVHSYGKEFEVQALSDYDTHPCFHTMNINNFFQIRKWAQKGYVDSVMILSFSKKWSPEREKQIKEFHGKLADTKTKLSFMLTSRSKKVLPFMEKIMKNKYIDEIILYEEEDIYKGDMYSCIANALEQANKARLNN